MAHSVVYLREDIKDIRRVDYAALSYCWGPRPAFLKLTERSLKFLKDGISASRLPKTFQDAIHVTTTLGLRFIWIDALCILQDSEADWLKEAAMMGEIYSKSFITLAATASEDSEGGLFYNRSPSAVNGCVITLSWGRLEQRYLCTREDPWSEWVQGAPLNDRAWAFQERALSSRTIHFASDQLYWDCGESNAPEQYASEQFPAGSSWDHQVELETGAQWKGKFASIGRQKILPDDEVSEIWNNVLLHYTQGKLSHGSDKLIALSGVVRFVSKCLQHPHYLAGLWKMDLAQSLLWQSGDVECSRAREYRAPSWSWASIDGLITPGTALDPEITKEEFVIDVLEAQTTLLISSNPFGPVTAGSIRVRGRILQASTSPSDFFNETSDLILRLGTHKTCCWYTSVDIDDSSAVEEFRKRRQIFCLLFTESPTLFDEGRGLCVALQGLLLIPIQTQRGLYRRVGHFSSRYWHSVEQIDEYLRLEGKAEDLELEMELHKGFNDHRVILEAFKSSRLQKECYEEFDGADKYTVTMI
jgi:hypothetical protein